VRSLADVSILSSGSADFGCFRAALAPSVLASLQFDLPTLVFFSQHRVVTSCRFPDNEQVLAHQGSEWLDPNLGAVDTRAEMFGHLPTSLIVRDGHSSGAVVLHALPYLRGCSVLRATPRLFADLGFESATHLVFRRADMTVVQIENTSLALYNASVPYFSKFNTSSFELGGFYAAYLDDDFNETRHAPLYDLGERHRSIRFGVLNKADFRLLDRVKPSLSNYPGFFVFLFSSGSCFPTRDFDELKITDPTWYPMAVDSIERVHRPSLRL
jgi:hypothetical protein